jgi:hypothetical protein
LCINELFFDNRSFVIASINATQHLVELPLSTTDTIRQSS